MSYDYALNYGPTANGEGGFRRCVDCAALVYTDARSGNFSLCRTGKPHDLDESIEFKLVESSDGKAQGGWRVCAFCGVVFQSGDSGEIFASGGVCLRSKIRNKMHFSTTKVYYIPFAPNPDGMLGPLEYAQNFVTIPPGECLRVKCIFNAQNKKRNRVVIYDFDSGLPMVYFDSARAGTGVWNEWVSPPNATNENYSYVIVGLHSSGATGTEWKPSLFKHPNADKKFAKIGFNESSECEGDKYAFNNAVVKVYIEKPQSSVEVSSVAVPSSD